MTILRRLHEFTADHVVGVVYPVRRRVVGLRRAFAVYLVIRIIIGALT